MSGGRVVFVDVAASSIAESSSVIPNDGTTPSNITVTVVNTDGRPMPGLPVTLTIESGTGTLTQPVGVTNQAGQVTGSVVSATLGTVVIGAEVVGVALTDTISVVVDGDFILPAANKYIDGLESMAKDNNDPNGINVDGFSWVNGAGIKFSIVRSDGYIVVNTSGNPIVPPTGPLPDAQYENAPDGTDGIYAARFRYPANSSSFAEQEFAFGAEYPEFWLRYWIRVPINYSHTNISGGATNNKWLAIWQDGYSTGGLGGQGVWATRPQAGNTLSSGASNIHYNHKAGLNGGVLGGDQFTVDDWIVYPRDRGRWMQVIHHMKVSSSLDVADGEMHLYRRWEDETTFALIHSSTTLVYNVPVGYTGFSAGYFLGASNSWFPEDTEFLMDRFEVSTTSLVP